jgi:FHS family Na+ dependent glucose MFS transporter 1
MAQNLAEAARSIPAALGMRADADQISKTAGYYVAFISLGLAGAVLGPTLPSLAGHTNSRLDEISILFVAHSVGYLIGSLIGGRLYDRVPGNPVMATALIFVAVALALAPIAPLLWLLVGVFLFMGLAAGVLDVGGNTLLVWVHGHQVGPFMNGLHFCWGLGAFLSPIIVAQAIAGSGDWSGDFSWAYWIVALLILPAALWVFRLPSPAAHIVSKDESAEGARYLQITLVSLFLFLCVSAEGAFGGWIFSYVVTLKIAAETAAAYMTSAFWGALTVGRLLAIPIAARVRPRYILLADVLGCLISVVIIMIWPQSEIATWLGALGMGLSMASAFPTTISLAGRHMTITGQATGFFFVGASLGNMGLPWLIGQRFVLDGPPVVMLSIAIDLALAIGVFFVLIAQFSRKAAAR